MDCQCYLLTDGGTGAIINSLNPDGPGRSVGSVGSETSQRLPSTTRKASKMARCSRREDLQAAVEVVRCMVIVTDGYLYLGVFHNAK